MKKQQSPLFLTAAEQAIFAKLPEAVRKGVVVETETIAFTDTIEHLEARLRNMKLESPALIKLQEQAKTKKFTEQEVAELAKTVDFSKLSQNDLIEISFAWGPGVFSHMIATALPLLDSPDQIPDLGNLAGIRHGLLLSFTQ